MSWITDCAVWEGIIIEPYPMPPVAGYTHWYDAADLATITDTAGVVSVWADKGSLDDDLAVPSGRVGPITGTRTINGWNALDFNGSATAASASALTYIQDLMANGASNPRVTVFVVFLVDADPNDVLGTLVLDVTVNGTSPEYGIRYDSANANAVWVINGGALRANILDTAVDITDGSAHVAMLTQTTSNVMTVAVDGGAGTSTGSLTAGFTDGNQFCVGSNLGIDGPRAHNGLIGEILIYGSDLSAPDIASTIAYLNDKWGL